MQKFCRALLFCGFSVQIILGICWMLLNFPYLQMFGESALYLDISKNLICDEYEGILYPVLILLARGIEEIFPIPYYCILYLVQVALAFAAGYYFLKTVRVADKKVRVWGSLALLTFPMAMQCHLAVLPESIVASCLLLELAFALQALLSGQRLSGASFFKVLVCWLTTALAQPEYLYLGAIPVVVLFVFGVVKAWKSHWKSIVNYVLLIMAFAGMITGMHSLTQVDGYYGRTHQSLNLSLASRCVWRFVHIDYDYWPEDVKAQFTPEEIRTVDYYADNVERIVGRTLERTLGVERTEEVFGGIAKHAWTYHKENIIHDTVWDAIGYTVSPLVVQRQFTGKVYDSYSGRNYDIMRMQTPRLTEVVLNYGCRWFAVGLVVTFFVQLVVLFREKRRFWSAGKGTAFLGWMLTVLGIVVYYTMRGSGMMDYKKSIAVTLLWLVWMLAVNLRGVRE